MNGVLFERFNLHNGTLQAYVSLITFEHSSTRDGISTGHQGSNVYVVEHW
jgi:hypothetical protein